MQAEMTHYYVKTRLFASSIGPLLALDFHPGNADGLEFAHSIGMWCAPLSRRTQPLLVIRQQTAPISLCRRLASRGDAEFLEDVRDVRLGRAEGEA